MIVLRYARQTHRRKFCIREPLGPTAQTDSREGPDPLDPSRVGQLAYARGCPHETGTQWQGWARLHRDAGKFSLFSRARVHACARVVMPRR